MTTRYYDKITNPLYILSDSSGTDGKYETVDGVQRLAWNNYSSINRREVRTPGRNVQNGNNDIWWNCTATAASILTANDELTLLSRLSEQVKGHNFNLAVSAAEGKKTVGMVTSAVSSIGGAILDLKKGRFESAARRFGVKPRTSRLSEKDVAGRWLELQYGWIPLLSDVYEASKAYESITSGHRKSRLSVSINRKGTKDTSVSPSNWTCKCTVDEKWRLIYEMSEMMSTPRSLGLTDPLSVAWELIPYSFVVDWFLPIGSYLENLNTIPTLRGRFMTIKVRNVQGSAVRVSNPLIDWIKYPTTYHSSKYFTRSVSTSLSVPRPGFETLPDAMSPSRIWNAIALVTQRIR